MRGSRFPVLLFLVTLLVLSCQSLLPAKLSCRVNIPTIGWMEQRDGDQITFTVDQTQWRARVDCKGGRMVDGEPVRPAGGRQMSLTVAESTYKVTTTDTNLSMVEYRENGSHIRIDEGDRYYVAVLTASSGGFGQAVISYFMGGQAASNIVPMYCYNQTKGEAHTSLLSLSSMWSESNPVTVNLVCSGQDFILELSTDITPEMLRQGPTAPAVLPPPVTPGPSAKTSKTD
jgi:hypothetical protein